MFFSIYADAACVKATFKPFVNYSVVMRRKDKEITDGAGIESIIRRSKVCRLAMVDDNRPYMVPLCFGYKDNSLYFHSAQNGKKIDVLKKNNDVCFEFDVDYEPIKADNACEWGMKYESVIGFGKASFIDDVEAKRDALDIIMKHYSDGAYTYPNTKLNNIRIIKVEIEHMTGKRSE